MMDDRAPAVSLEGVSFTYRGASTAALRDVTLRVRRGEMVVVMGATGAGKTTLAKCVGRVVPFFQPGRLEGTVRIEGNDVGGAGVSDLAGVVGLVSQDFEAQLFATNVAEEVAFGMEQLGVERPEMERRLAAALALVGLSDFERRDPVSLSGGEKQRLAIAAVVALEARILVFDEPTTDLDPAGKAEVFAALARMREAGFTIILIEHEIAAAERADRLVLMSEGRIIADDRPEPLLYDVERLEGLGVRPADLDRLARRLCRPRRFSSLDEAAAELRGRVRPPEARPSPAAARGEPILALDRVSFAYGGAPALREVTLCIAPGEFVAVIGQNGSGKTTLAKHLNGLLHPTSGTVRLDGEDVAELSLNRVARAVGYVFQDPDQQIFAASVRDEVEFALRNFGVAREEIERRVSDVLGAVGLAGLEDLDPFLLGKGQRQRLAVASLLALRPRVLVLDEPTTGLDDREQRRVMDLLAGLHRGGMTVVMITHSPWLVAEYAERGVLMRAGEIVFDGPLRELFAEEDLLESCRFRLPELTRLGRRLGFTPLTLDELVGALAPATSRGGPACR